MMSVLRKRLLFIDTCDIKIRAHYIPIATNMWAENLSRGTDNSDWQISLGKFKHFNKKWGPHTIDRFTSYANKQLPRYNAKWRDGTTEAVDNLTQPDAEGRRERN